jgi:hypothetical protein
MIREHHNQIINQKLTLKSYGLQIVRGPKIIFKYISYLLSKKENTCYRQNLLQLRIRKLIYLKKFEII